MSLHYGYVAFLFCFTFILFLDFSVSNKVKGGISYKVSASITAACFAIAMVFAFGLYLFSNKEDSLLFITGYLIEFSLSIDNIFIFILIFQKFNISDRAQRRVLTIGILSAIVLRFVAISFGIGILERMTWLFYVFGFILIYGGLSIIRDKGSSSEKKELGKFTASLLKKFFRTTNTQSDQFIVKKDGKLYLTNLFIALILIEKSDIIFAADSIPVILSITNDVFIVFTSNMFAILGMRSMYFLVNSVSKRFIYIRYGLAVILIYMGIKMICARLGFVFDPLFSIAVIAFSFIIPICISLRNGCPIKKDVSS